MNMKKWIVPTIVAAVAALLGWFASPAPVHASWFGATGVKVYNMPVSASTVTLVAVGSGYLYDVQITSGTVGSDAVCFDSASITGITASLQGQPSNGVNELADVVISASNTTTSLPSGTPVVPFTNGLVCAESAAIEVRVYYKQ